MTFSSPPSNSLDNLFKTPASPGLGPGPRHEILPIPEIENRMRTLQSGGFPPAKDQAALIFCVALIWNDHWTQAHELAQDIHTPDGSLLHAILHRREPDYWNSKYWLRRVGNHPALAHISKAFTDTFTTPPAGASNMAWFQGGRFDPLEFVDACERVSSQPDSNEVHLLEKAQAVELRTLLRFFASRGGES